MLSHPHLLGRDADEMDESHVDSADYLEQKRREPRQRVIASSENSHVRPRVEVMLNRQQKNVLVSPPVAKLDTIGVSFPANATQQFTIGGMESDQVAATAMVRAENKLF